MPELDYVGILEQLLNHEREAFEKYHRTGQSYFGSPQARDRWLAARDRIDSFLEWIKEQKCPQDNAE